MATDQLVGDLVEGVAALLLLFACDGGSEHAGELLIEGVLVDGLAEELDGCRVLAAVELLLCFLHEFLGFEAVFGLFLVAA